MQFETVIFRRSNGAAPAKEFMLQLKSSQPDLYDLVLAGTKKLKDSRYHKSKLVKPLGQKLFEMRVGNKDIARMFFAFGPDRKVILLCGIVKKDQKTPKSDLDNARILLKEFEKGGMK